MVGQARVEKARKVLLVSSITPLPLLTHLRKAFQVETASSIQMAEFLANEWEPEILILEDKIEFLQWVPRTETAFKTAPLGIIALGFAPQNESEKLSFHVGCDHWVNVENPDAILWRIQALLNRHGSAKPFTQTPAKNSSGVLQINNLKIYMDSFLVKRMGEVVAISPTQFTLLATFLKQPDQLLSRESLKKQVWTDSDISLRSIDAQISKLRKILPELDAQLMNVYGKGYIFSMNRQQAA